MRSLHMSSRREAGDAQHAEEVRRLARGWRRTLEVCERLKRLDEGRPLVELVRD